MTREEKTAAIAVLKEELGNAPFFYLADSSTLTVDKINKFRRLCFQNDVTVKVAKNKLIQKALEGEDESKGYAALFDVLHGPTTIMISSNPKTPAKLITEFRKSEEKPILKAAYIDATVFIGDDQLSTLTKIKSKDEIIGEIVTLLQSPARNLAGLITATGSKLAGIVKTLEERSE
ncbi:MAG: 50S ribosomal protein L10 [Saprospiraceae bacterium]|nr:50S ribosomal protein L10 [Saprospiraceae bacterium]MCB9344927.1 50S ribosomal protein L10 [Lewinellaceae bacterium]